MSTEETVATELPKVAPFTEHPFPETTGNDVMRPHPNQDTPAVATQESPGSLQEVSKESPFVTENLQSFTVTWENPKYTADVMQKAGASKKEEKITRHMPLRINVPETLNPRSSHASVAEAMTSAKMAPIIKDTLSQIANGGDCSFTLTRDLNHSFDAAQLNAVDLSESFIASAVSLHPDSLRFPLESEGQERVILNSFVDNFGNGDVVLVEDMDTHYEEDKWTKTVELKWMDKKEVDQWVTDWRAEASKNPINKHTPNLTTGRAHWWESSSPYSGANVARRIRNRETVKAFKQ